MVYLIDTNTTELNEVDVNGRTCPIIRHNQKLFEKHFPVMIVTDREEVTWYVCDFIPFKEFRPSQQDHIFESNVLYNQNFIDRLKWIDKKNEKK